ncbi:MAG TPA: sulfotransferase [Actinomycetota bacterium]|nr:sulfotransferase [Actinomycetota bacterium]
MSEPQGRLPTFLIIGAMKCGTTSLYHYLREHPGVFMPEVKAPEFFAGGAHWRRGIDWYRGLFAAAKPGTRALGEASNVYAKYPRYRGVPERIALAVPGVKLIYAIRDPVERIRSHWQTRASEGSERRPLHEAAFADPIYLDYSRYAMQIEQYLPVFPREQIMVIRAEDLRDDRIGTLARVYEFIGVDPAFVPPNVERAFYRTGDRAARSPVPVWLRKGLKRHLPATKRAKELENNIVGAIRRASGRQPLRAEVPPTTRARILDALAGDRRRLEALLPDHPTRPETFDDPLRRGAAR